jgi:PAS domain S-box-containing protein
MKLRLENLTFGTTVLVALLLSLAHRFLLFHGLVEAFSVVVAAGIFVVAWNSRHMHQDSYLVVLAPAYLCLSALHLIHLFSYDGMLVFPDGGTNLPTQLWVGARYVECGALLAAPLLARRKVDPGIVWHVYLFISILLGAAILEWGIFPDCHLPDVGLTPFKKTSEYLLAAVLLGAIIAHRRAQLQFAPRVRKLIISGILLSVLSGLSFTLYRDVKDPWINLGHLLKLASFWVLYKAVIETGLRTPQDLLFNRLREKERSILKANDDWQRTFDAVPDMVSIIGNDSRILRVNNAMAQRFGCQAEELVGKPCHVVMHGCSGRPGSCVHRALQQDDCAHSEEVHLERLGGDFIVSVNPIHDQAGNTTGIVHVAHDITQRKQMEEELRIAYDRLEERVAERTEELHLAVGELRQSEHRLAEAQRVAHLGSWEWDVQEQKGYWSPELYRILGIKGVGNSPSTRKYLRAIHREDRHEVLRALRHLIHNNEPMAIDHRILRRDGQTCHVHIVGRTEFDVYDQPTLRHGVVQDITPRKRAERALARSEKSLAEAQRIAHVGNWDVSLPSGVATWSNETFRILGYPPQTFIPTFELLIEAIHPADRTRAREQLTRNRSNIDANVDGHFRVLRPDGTERHIRLQGHCLAIQQQRPSRVVGTIHDVTTLRSVELESRRLQMNLAHMDRVMAMGTLTAALAHETNQPLTGILSNAQAALRFMKRDEPDIEEVHDCLQDIVADSKRAGNVVRRLRAMVKKEPLRRQRLDVNELIDEVYALLSNEVILRQATLNTRHGENLPPVMGDPVQLQQVMLNLAINGLDAVREIPSERRSVTLFSQLAADGGVELVTVDSGDGIPPETLGSIFKPFFTTKEKGMGVGLSVCRTIMEAHGGKLAAKNTVDSGAAFTVWLPKADDEAALPKQDVPE